MKEDQILRYLWIAGISIFYAFVSGVVLFLINGIKNGWQYQLSSASYELSFYFAIILSTLVLAVFSTLTFVVSMVFFRLLRDNQERSRD